MSSEDKDSANLDKIEFRVHVLAISLIALSSIFALYMIVKCAVLIVSAIMKKTKKKKVESGPTSVSVKGDSKKNSSSSKKKSSSGKKGSSRSTSKSSKTVKPKKRQSSSKESLSSVPSQPKKPCLEKDKKSAPKAKAEKPKDTPSPFKGFKSGDFAAEPSTPRLIAQIPPQFESPKTASSLQSDVTSVGTSTEKINAAIPNQFDCSVSVSPRLQSMNATQPSPAFVREIAQQVVAYLTAGNNPAPAADLSKQPVYDIATPKPAKNSLKSPASHRQLEIHEKPRGRIYTDSAFVVDMTGSNGEITGAIPPSLETNATNSLILDSQKVVPIDGRPEAVPKQPNEVQAQPKVAQQAPVVAPKKPVEDSVFYMEDKNYHPKEQ